MAAIKAHPFFAGVDWARVLARGYEPPIVPLRDADVAAAANFPHDDSPSSMDVEFEDELAYVRMHNVSFPGFQHDTL